MVRDDVAVAGLMIQVCGEGGEFFFEIRQRNHRPRRPLWRVALWIFVAHDPGFEQFRGRKRDCGADRAVNLWVDVVASNAVRGVDRAAPRDESCGFFDGGRGLRRRWCRGSRGRRLARRRGLRFGF